MKFKISDPLVSLLIAVLSYFDFIPYDNRFAKSYLKVVDLKSVDYM